MKIDKNVLVKNCKGQSYTLPKTKALNESHIYGIKNNQKLNFIIFMTNKIYTFKIR